MVYCYYTLLAYAYLWIMGWGLTYFILPPRLASYGAVFCPFVGLGLSTLLAWYAYRANLPGTDVYGPYILVVGVVLAVVAFAHRRMNPARKLPSISIDTTLALGAGALALLVVTIPFVIYPAGPTAMSLGNNDIADYACMSRLIKEFPRDTMQGFLGQFGGFRVMSDEIWFGPAAGCALIASFLHVPVFRVESLSINLFFALGVPFVYVIAREFFKLDRWYSASLAILFALHPVMYRVVYDGFQGQLMATAIVPGILVAGILCAEGGTWRDKARFVPLLVALNWALIMSYSYMIIFAYFVIVAYVASDALIGRKVRDGVISIAVLGASVVGAFLLSPFRAAMIYKQLGLAKAQSGYYLGFLSPDRVMGILGADMFASEPQRLWGQVTIVLVVAVALCGIAWSLKRERKIALIAVPLFVIYAFSAYIFFKAEGTQRIYASYKAYKPIGVFLPMFFCLFFVAWDHLVRTAGRWRWAPLAFAVVLIGACNIFSVRHLIIRMCHTEAIVTEDMAQLAEVDRDPRIKSLNVFTADPWPYMWHTYFLMNKQLHLQSTWYARPRNPPVGEYDLLESGSLDIISAPQRTPNREVRYLNKTYSLAKSTNRSRPLVEFGHGWWGKEPTHRWAGASGNSYGIIVSSVEEGVRVRVEGDLHIPLREDDKITLTLDGKEIGCTHSTTRFQSEPFELRKGKSVLEFRHSLPVSSPSAHDPRTLLVAWRSIVVEFVDGSM